MSLYTSLVRILQPLRTCLNPSAQYRTMQFRNQQRRRKLNRQSPRDLPPDSDIEIYPDKYYIPSKHQYENGAEMTARQLVVNMSLKPCVEDYNLYAKSESKGGPEKNSGESLGKLDAANEAAMFHKISKAKFEEIKRKIKERMAEKAKDDNHDK